MLVRLSIKCLGGLRLWFRDKLDLADKDMMAFAWVVDFPFFAFNEETQAWESEHHPFTMPKMEDLPKFDTTLVKCIRTRTIWFAMAMRPRRVRSAFIAAIFR
jgi:aspartyl-tRNA synthetase